MIIILDINKKLNVNELLVSCTTANVAKISIEMRHILNILEYHIMPVMNLNWKASNTLCFIVLSPAMIAYLYGKNGIS